MSFSTIFSVIALTLAFLHTVTSTGSSRTDPGSTIAISIKIPSKSKSIKKAGVSRGLEECQRLFKDQVWDCSFYNKSVTGELPDFMQRTLPYANRETAFLHAITTAGILQEIISQCTANKITECSCDRKKGRRCNDKLSFAKKATRRLITIPQPWNDERRKINKHNQDVGIGVFEKNYRSCRSTETKSCNTLRKVANELRKKYDSAIKKTNRPSPMEEVFQRSDTELTYWDSSPNYCVSNVTAGSPGLEGRVCGNNGRKTRHCKSLCRRCDLKLKRVCKNCSDENTKTVCMQKNPKH